MAHRTAAIEGILVVRWDDTPDLEGVAAITKEARELCRTCGKKIVLLVVVPPKVGLPNADVRKVFTDQLATMMQSARCMVMVLEGEGLLHSVKLSVVTGIQLLMSHQKSIYVRDSLEEALIRKKPPELAVDGLAVLQEIKRRRLTS